MHVAGWGGAFAKYMNVKFTASPDQALDYLRRAGVPCYFEFQGEETGCRVVATHALLGAPEPSPETHCEKGFFLLTEKGILAEPWFGTVYDIRHGWYYYWADWPTRYHVYYDLDSRQFYVYWMYS